MRTIGYVHVVGQRPKKYGVFLFNCVGEPVQDRQRCANTLKEAYLYARDDMRHEPLSCACIYIIKNKKAIPVRNIDAAGRVTKPTLF